MAEGEKKKTMRELLRSEVSQAVAVERSMGSDASGRPGALVPGVKHQGVLVTLMDDSQYLIHKGNGYGGKGGETVVTDAANMTAKWKWKGSPVQVTGVKVTDLVKAGGQHYNLVTDNCYNAQDRMMELIQKRADMRDVGKY